MGKQTKNSYWGILPAKVRYDDRLSPNAKLLYSELTALTNSKGYSWASNAHFASLYKVHKNTISRWINKLVVTGHIRSEVTMGQKGYERKIYLCEKITMKSKKKMNVESAGPINHFSESSSQNQLEGINEISNKSHQNAEENKTLNIIDEKDKRICESGKSARPDNPAVVIDFMLKQGVDASKAEAEGNKFWNHYLSVGWKVGGRAPMKDWKASARQWVARIEDFTPARSAGGSSASVEVIDYKELRKQRELEKLMRD